MHSNKKHVAVKLPQIILLYCFHLMRFPGPLRRLESQFPGLNPAIEIEALPPNEIRESHYQPVC